MATYKKRMGISVLQAAENRIRYAFAHFDRIYISFSGGKDSSVMFHLVMQEAIKKNKRVGVLFIDLEAQYKLTIKHVEDMFVMYKDLIDIYWVCLPIKLRNAVSNYEPVWCAWDPDRKIDWVRDIPSNCISDVRYFDFFEPGMEFEEFIELFAVWYSKGQSTAAFIGIRADESLNRYRTIASSNKETHFGKLWTTKVIDNTYNIYPIYDWKVSDIWTYHAKYNNLPHNEIYDRMYMAGVSYSQMRLCQPYGDDQRKGLWLYQILEPHTWGKLIARVNGVNSGSLYINESGNMTGYNKITLPANHTWKSFTNLLLSTMPEVTRNHYIERFNDWLINWHKRGYTDGIPDEAPRELENKSWVPSWRRLCKVLLRNDWWCKGLGLTQPKSEAYGRYLAIKKQKIDNNELGENHGSQ